MTTTVIINIAIEIFCSVMCAVFIICILVGDSLKFRLNRVFTSVLLSNIAVMLSDALAFSSIGKPEPIFRVLNFIGNFSTFIFSYVIIMAFSNYINSYLATKIEIKRIGVYAVYSVCSLAIILTFLSLFNGMYFSIDQNNVYHRGNMYWLSQVLGIISLLINATVIIKYRKSFNRMEKFALFMYIILPVIAVIIQMLVYGFVSVYIASTITITIIYVGMQAQYGKTIKENELALERSRTALMLSQINPHFLYNTLTSIRSMCVSTPQKAEEAIEEFSGFLRGNMDSISSEELIPFEKEFEHLMHYLRIEKMRFEHRLNIVTDIQTTDFCLPSLTVQPIAENAVRHGVSKKLGGGTVTILTREAENHFEISVIDNGVGFNTESLKANIGIGNVRSRLTLQCGGELLIKSQQSVGTTAVIKIPKGVIQNAQSDDCG